MNLVKVLNEHHVFIAENFENTDVFYSEFAIFLKERKIISDHEKIKRLFIKRENIQSTAIGKGAAAPHIFSEEFKEFIFSIALIKNGLDFKAPDGELTFLVFLIMSDERDVGMHLKSLAHIARLVDTTNVVEEARKANTAAEIVDVLVKKDNLI